MKGKTAGAAPTVDSGLHVQKRASRRSPWQPAGKLVVGTVARLVQLLHGRVAGLCLQHHGAWVTDQHAGLACLHFLQGQQPLVFYTPLGKNSVRSVHTAAPEGAAAKGAKLEREYMPGYKLKTENKKPIVGLEVHPFGGWVGGLAGRARQARRD